MRLPSGENATHVTPASCSRSTFRRAADIGSKDMIYLATNDEEICLSHSP
jgi:hypothetical protein